MRRPLLSAVLLCSAVFLAACSPGESGVIGLTVNESGQPIVVLQDCKGEIDKVVLSVLPSSRGERGADVARWTNPDSPKGIVQFPLYEGSGRWRSDAPVPGFDVRRRYVLNGWQENDATKAGRVPFTLTMLEDLQPNQVLRAKLVAQDEYATEVVTLAQFTPTNCG